MKVIVAGYPKTGTKSMNAALNILGYSVYDFMENMVLLQKEYKKIIHKGWTTEDFKQMYEDVDSIVDFPAFYFWEEIHKAFPDAKIVLSMRENEDVWLESFKRQMRVQDTNIFLRLLQIVSPSARSVFEDVIYPMYSITFGIHHSRWRLLKPINGEMMKLKYRAHNAHVMENAPADKLLVYQCKEGWEPLCEFLGVPVPDQPFPHKNLGGSVIQETLKENPIVKIMVREMVIISALLAAFTVTGYYTYIVGPSGILHSIRDGFSNIGPSGVLHSIGNSFSNIFSKIS